MAYLDEPFGAPVEGARHIPAEAALAQ